MAVLVIAVGALIGYFFWCATEAGSRIKDGGDGREDA